MTKLEMKILNYNARIALLEAALAEALMEWENCWSVFKVHNLDDLEKIRQLRAVLEEVQL